MISPYLLWTTYVKKIEYPDEVKGTPEALPQPNLKRRMDSL